MKVIITDCDHDSIDIEKKVFEAKEFIFKIINIKI